LKSVLLLEDEFAVMELLKCILKPYNLIEAGTAEDAIRLFTERGRKLELLLADLSLPKSSGVQVALLLRSVIPDLPVILTSGYPVSSWSDRDSADLDRLGADSVKILQKPFQAQALLHTVRELIDAPQAERTRTA
jgi:two-component system, cell cycle sensor histidine kinase and response regulator CckA